MFGVSVLGSEADNFRLVIDTDADFTANATTLTADSYSTTTDIVSFDAVNLADGNYFTLGLVNNILSVDIVNASGIPINNPSIDLGVVGFSLVAQTSTGILGTDSEKIRISNSTAGATWTLSIAASSTEALWTSASSTYDFNDGAADAGDGTDDDSVGGQLTIDPYEATLTPQSGCLATGISKGTASSFSEVGGVNSITIANSDASANTDCVWDLTDIDLSQTIPRVQTPGSYQLDLTLSIIAS